MIAPGVDVGMIFVFAMGSIAVYGVVLGGWASNNKYSFLGGLRSSAQLIAYELPMGLGILGVVLSSGSLRLDAIMEHQAQTGAWNAFVQPLGMIVFCVAAFAEASRLPFDLPEAEQELIGGYHTEYFGIKLMMYLVGEYLHMVAAAFLIVMLVLRRLALLGPDRLGQQRHLGRGHPANRGAQRQGAGHDLFLHGGPLELGPFPLRSIDVAGLAGDVAAGHGQPGLRGDLGRVRRSMGQAVPAFRRRWP